MFANFSTVATVGIFKDASNKVMGYVDFMDGRQAENARAAFDGWAGFGEPLQVAHNYAQDTSYKRPRDDYVEGGQAVKQARASNGMGMTGGYQMGNGSAEGPMGQYQQDTGGPMSGYSAGLGIQQQQPPPQQHQHQQQTLQQQPQPQPSYPGMSQSMLQPPPGQLPHSQSRTNASNLGTMSGYAPPLGAPHPRPMALAPPHQPPPQRPPYLTPPGQQGVPLPARAPPPAAPPHMMMGHQLMGPPGPVPPPVLAAPPPGPVMQMPILPLTRPLVPGPRPPPPQPGPRPPPTLPLPPNAAATLHIDIIPNDASMREVAHVFRHFEGYRHTRIVQRDSAKRPGDKITMAFIEFSTPQQAAFVMAKMQGYIWDLEEEGSPSLRLSYAKPHSKPSQLYKRR